MSVGDHSINQNMLSLSDVSVTLASSQNSLIRKSSDFIIGEIKMLIPLLTIFGRETLRKN